MSEEPVSILVVDDHPENIKALQGVLSRGDYHIVTAPSGEEALRRILQHEFAVILLDVLMPGMDGFQTAQLIRERDRSRGIPILFLTATGSDLAMIDRAYSVGAVDYLVKPLDPDVVRAKVAVFVDLHRKARRIEKLREAERRRSEEELRDREAEYQATFEGAPAGIAQLALDGRLLRANPRFCQLFGVDWAGVEGRPFGELLHPEDVGAARAALERLLAGDGVTDQRVHRGVRRDGGLVWVNRRVSLLRDAEGQASRFIVVLDDLTERLRAEESQRLLARAGELLLSSLDARAALERVAQLVVPALADGCSVYLAQEAAEGKLELVSKAGDDCAPHREELPLTARGRSLGSVVLHFVAARTPDARDRSVAKEVAQRVAFAVDNARLYQSAQEAVRLRDEFLSIASHELRTPLTPLQLQLQRLCSERRRANQAPPLSPEKVRAALLAVDRQVHRLVALVDNLLDVSRITTGRLELHREEVDLRELASEVASRFADLGARPEAGVLLEPSEPVLGSFDRLRIEQVVTNLLSNAMKYGQGKAVRISVQQRQGEALISVQDQGIGIAPEELGRIFERFERAVSARNYGGLGLGLYITRQIVEAHGGRVKVQSQPGAGSVFSVELPLHAGERAGVAA